MPPTLLLDPPTLGLVVYALAVLALVTLATLALSPRDWD